MTFYIVGPNLNNFATDFVFNVGTAIPTDLLQEVFQGIMFRNKSPFEAKIQGYGGRSYLARPHADVYIPNLLGLPFSQLTNFIFSTLTPTVMNIEQFLNQSGIMDLMFYLANDTPPSVSHSNVPHATETAIAGTIEHKEINITATSGVVVGGSASTVTLQASHTVFGGLWLTRVSFWFGIPAAAVALDVQLQDGNNFVLETWHLNMGAAPMPAYREIMEFVHPYISRNNPSQGVGTWKVVIPAVAGGPSFVTNMGGYFR